MLKSTLMLSLRAAAAGSTVILSAAAQPVLAQIETHTPFMTGDVKTAAKHLAKEPIDPMRVQGIAAAETARTNALAGPAAPRTARQNDATPYINRFSTPVYDVAADGSIWARGRTYKAHFAADGFTYIPYLGGSAPRNFPITFSIEAIDIAGVAMDLAQPTISREGDRVTIDRSGVVETYELTADSIEQLFVFAHKPAAGAAKILLNVQSELNGERDGSVHRFANEFGSVSYTDAVTVDAAGSRIGAATQMTDQGALEITISDSVMAGAKYPLTVDPVLSTFTLNAPEGTGTLDGQSDIAYDVTSGKWMLVWEENFSATDGDIYCMFCDQAGQPISGTLATINGDSTNARHPRIANNNLYDKFLIAYEKGAAPSRSIWSRWRANSGSTVEDEIHVSNSGFSGDHHSPDVGGDPNFNIPSFGCITWQRDYSATDTDILARLVSPAVNNIVGNVIAVDTSSGTLDRSPSISNSCGFGAASGRAWTIVWEHQFSPSDRDIYAAQISQGGTLTQPTFAIDSSGSDDRNPTVSSPHADAPRFIVAYEENGSFLYARVFNGTSIVTGGNLTALEGATPAEHAWAPVADAIDGKFIVAFQQTTPGWLDSDAFVSTFCAATGSLRVAETHRRLAVTSSNEEQVQLASAFASGASDTNRNALSSWTRRVSGQHGQVRGAAYVGPLTCCRADVAPVGGDGQINVTDLLAVITQWGSGYDASANVNGDSIVNVSDLLEVITAWGACQ